MRSKKTETKEAPKELSDEQRVKAIHKGAFIDDKEGLLCVYAEKKGDFLAAAKTKENAWKKALHRIL